MDDDERAFFAELERRCPVCRHLFELVTWQQVCCGRPACRRVRTIAQTQLGQHFRRQRRRDERGAV